MPVGYLIAFGMNGFAIYVGACVQPASTCDHPWNMWFTVVGIVGLVMQTLLVFTVKSQFNMIMYDHVLKAKVYTEQNSTLEAQEEIAAFNAESTGGIGLLLVYCGSCVFGLFFAAMDVWAIIMAFHNENCTVMPMYLWIFLGIWSVSFGISTI